MGRVTALTHFVAYFGKREINSPPVSPHHRQLSSWLNGLEGDGRIRLFVHVRHKTLMASQQARALDFQRRCDLAVFLR